MPERDVWITGLGVYSAIGTNVQEFTENLYRGIAAAHSIPPPKSGRMKRTVAALIKTAVPAPEWKEYPRGVQMALLAVRQALADAGILHPDRLLHAGISIGTMLGPIPDLQKTYLVAKKQLREIKTEQLLQFSMSSIGDAIAAEFRLKGIRGTTSLVCISSMVSIGMGFQWIRRGRADLVLCGGTESFSVFGHQIMSQLGLIAPDVTRPFDENSRGFLLGEGAGILILEAREHAEKRGIQPYCTLAGYGCACDGKDLSQPAADGGGLTTAIRKAACNAPDLLDSIDFIHAHGVGSRVSDRAEVQALRTVFGKRLAHIPIYSIKGSIGHTSGAAGAMNVISAVAALQHSTLPPTLHYVANRDYADLSITRETYRLQRNTTCLANTIGFGGLNASIILKRDDSYR